MRARNRTFTPRGRRDPSLTPTSFSNRPTSLGHHSLGALLGRLQSNGAAFGNYGMAIRHDNGKHAGFVMMAGGHTSGNDIGAVG